MPTYKEHIVRAMEELSDQQSTIVIGYNCSKAGGYGAQSFNSFPDHRIIEMPLAENLMTGAAIGLSLEGYIPIVWYERSDFVLLALDAIVNHLDKLANLSKGLHKPAALLRMVVGNSQVPLFTGPTHTQNVAPALRKLVNFSVVELRANDQIEDCYARSFERALQGESTALVEFKDLYDKVIP